MTNYYEETTDLEMDELQKKTTESALETIQEAQTMIFNGTENESQGVVEEKKVESSVSNGGDDVASQFAGLPIESLICAPIIAAAKGQQELTAVYIDGIKKLAYKENSTETNELVLKANRPVQNAGQLTTQECEIHAPLLALVPVPAFTMDELVVEFDMEVKASTLDTDEEHAKVASSVNCNSLFGMKASITGSVAADRSHRRSTDTSATYHIMARAVQQPPTEGMSKLANLFSSMMEPITVPEQSK